MKKLNKKGFTLVELLVTVSLLSIVTIIAINLVNDLIFMKDNNVLAYENQVTRAVIIDTIEQDLLAYGWTYSTTNDGLKIETTADSVTYTINTPSGESFLKVKKKSISYTDFEGRERTWQLDKSATAEIKPISPKTKLVSKNSWDYVTPDTVSGYALINLNIPIYTNNPNNNEDNNNTNDDITITYYGKFQDVTVDPDSLKPRPFGLTVLLLSKNRIRFLGTSIDQSGTGIKGYYFSTNGGASWSTIQTTANYYDFNATPGTSYSLMMRAEDNAKNTTNSSPKTVKIETGYFYAAMSNHNSSSWDHVSDVYWYNGVSRVNTTARDKFAFIWSNKSSSFSTSLTYYMQDIGTKNAFDSTGKKAPIKSGSIITDGKLYAGFGIERDTAAVADVPNGTGRLYISNYNVGIDTGSITKKGNASADNIDKQGTIGASYLPKRGDSLTFTVYGSASTTSNWLGVKTDVRLKVHYLWGRFDYQYLK